VKGNAVSISLLRLSSSKTSDMRTTAVSREDPLVYSYYIHHFSAGGKQIKSFYAILLCLMPYFVESVCPTD